MTAEIDPHVQALRDLMVAEHQASIAERQRWAVALHHLGGLTWAEVAALVGGTEQAARRAGADGVAALRRTGGWR